MSHSLTKQSSTKQLSLTKQSAIYCLLVSLGLRQADAEAISETIVATRDNRQLRSVLLTELSCFEDTQLRIRIALAVIKLINCETRCINKLWEVLVAIWEKTRINLAVASHRLNSSISNLQVTRIAMPARIEKPQLVAVA